MTRVLRLAPLLALAVPSLAYAQAWVPTEMSLSVSFDYAYVWSSSDVLKNETISPLDGETTRFIKAANLSTHVFIPTIDFAPIENLGFRVWLPMALSGCTEEGMCAHRHPDPTDHVDDGKSRFTLQDVNIEGRYMIDIPDAITFAPMIAFSAPTNDYATVGHAIVGRGRPQLRAGLNVGRGLTELVPGMYFQARYQFAYVFPLKEDAYKDVAGTEYPKAATDSDTLSNVSINRSMVDFELGYFIFEDLSIRATFHYEHTHGGVEYNDVLGDPTSVVNRNHDVLGAERYFLLGGGLTYILLEEVFLSATFLKWIDGSNTHDSDSINFSVGYTIF